MSHHDVNRRTITKGLAWAVPAVSAAAALPAYAVSCPGTAAPEIDSWFAAYQSSLPDLTGVNMAISFNQSAGLNGAGLSNVGISLKNIGTKSFDSSFPLGFDVGIQNVATSKVVNDSLTAVAGPANTNPILKPWAPQGDNRSPPLSDAQAVGNTTRKRSFSMTSSNLTFYNPSTNARIGTSSDQSNATAFPDTPSAYGWRVALRNTTWNPGDREKVLAIVPGDGAWNGGRIYAAWGIRLRGFAPLPWTTLVTNATAAHPGMTENTVTNCYLKLYDQRVERWIAGREGLRNMKISIDGWNATMGSVMGWENSGAPNTWYWSTDVGNFMAAGTEYDTSRVTGVDTWSTSVVKTSSVGQSITEIRHRDGIF